MDRFKTLAESAVTALTNEISLLRSKSARWHYIKDRDITFCARLTKDADEPGLETVQLLPHGEEDYSLLVFCVFSVDSHEKQKRTVITDIDSSSTWLTSKVRSGNR